MKKYIFLASAVVALAACSSNEEFEQIGKCEIKLNSTLLVQTRAAQGIQSTEFESGAEMAVFINENTSGTPSVFYPQPLKYIFGDDKSLTTQDTQYYPQNGNGVTIYAVYPYAAGENITDIEQEEEFAVQSNQSDSASYKASDLMIGFPTTDDKVVYRTTDEVTLQFSHCLSKINVTVKAGDGVDPDELKDATVIIYTNTNKATFNVKTGDVVGATSQAEAASPYVTMGTLTSSQNGFEGLSAIIIPQAISAGSQFIMISTTGQHSYSYIIPNTVNEVAFAGGKAYTYNLTVRKSDITIDKITITDWDNVGETDGDAYRM